MKHGSLSALCAGFLALSCEAVQPLTTEEDKVSYSIGVDIGNHFRDQGITIKPETFIMGLQQAQKSQPLLMTDQEVKDTLLALQARVLDQQNEERNVLAEQNLKDGQAFLEKNKAMKGIQVTPSGLQYRVLEEGQGTAPGLKDRVKTHYRGTFIDGTEFDSSYSRGEPIEFPVNGVIPGWTEALQMMKPGSKWQLYIPSNLAYGEHGVGNVIGPNTTLVFDIELLEIDRKPTTNTAAAQ